jgi:hypothetical protein
VYDRLHHNATDRRAKLLALQSVYRVLKEKQDQQQCTFVPMLTSRMAESQR